MLVSHPNILTATRTTNDTVGGNIIANQPLTMYLTAVTVRGSVVSNGGGPGPTLNPYINFPVKENKIGGNLIMQGWQGAWLGALRNTVGGNLIVQKNVGVTHGDGGAPDSTEIVDNTVGGNLICHGNSPAAQVGDSGGRPQHGLPQDRRMRESLIRDPAMSHRGGGFRPATSSSQATRTGREGIAMMFTCEVIVAAP